MRQGKKSEKSLGILCLGGLNSWEHKSEEAGRSGTEDEFSFCRFAFKECPHPGGNVQNVVRSIAFDNIKSYRLRRRIHLGWSSCCRNRMKSARGRI